jgi:type IV pilus secretin PilQ/predicted competence protein
LNYSSAKELEGTLKSKLTRYGSISSEDRTNSVIINDIADNIEKIEALIKILDIPTLQVSLEAKIVDVRLNSGLQTGVHLTNLYRTNYSQSPLLLQNGAPSPWKPTANYTQNLSGDLATSGRLTLSVLSNGYDIEGYIEALKSDTDAKLLANPRLLVMSNQEANIEIIDQIPYEQYTISDGVTTITTIFKDVGIRLKVKPQINRDGTVVLNVSPEQSFRTTETIGKVPVVNTTRSNTTFILRNGETAVLGGLIRESDVKTEYKVPLLGDIPILGFLFKNFNKEKQRTELTIFITAHVMQL